MSEDYERGLAQFRQMVGDERVDALVERFRISLGDARTLHPRHHDCWGHGRQDYAQVISVAY